MSLDPEFLQLLMETFQGELNDQLQQITDGLLQLEKAASEAQRQEVLNAIFRAAHNIKGAARGVDAVQVAEIAHKLESLFMAWRAGTLAPTPAVVDLSLQTLDHIRDVAVAEREGGTLGFDKEALLARLQAAVEGQAVAPAPPPPPPPPAAPAGPKFSTESEIFAETDALPASAPAPAAPSAGKPVEPGGEAIRVPAAKLQRVSALTEELQVAKIAMAEHFAASHSLNLQIAKLESRLQVLRPLLRQGAKSGANAEVHATLNEGLRELGDVRAIAASLSKAMRRTASRMGILTSALQSDVRMLQLVPISTTLRPMARIVRDLGRELGKQVSLQISGDHIEMDRSVLDGVRDPLMHLMRNAIDHGLETPTERQAAGKPEEGTIRLSVASAGGQIHLTVKDDGRGIDAERVAAIALARRIVQAEELEHMDRQGKLELIFRPGFSSKEVITDLSGRGVGLDVVGVNIRKLNGSVKLETQPGQGTTFTLKVPLTLSTERGLHVRAGGEDMVIPSTAVERILEIDAPQVLDVAGSQAILVNHKAVALRNLAATLALPPRVVSQKERIPVVIVSKGWTQVAFVVDEVAGEREIVVKRLLPPLRSVPHVSGATLTGSGDIMMVLNVSDLVDSAQRQSGKTGFAETPGGGHGKAAAPHILIVDDSITTRTLEKGILEAHGFRVTVATDGARGWDLLQQEQFDLVVTDVEMPVMNGFELTGKIKQTPQLAQMPVIMVTSLARDEDKRRGVEVGADAYIVKGEFETQVLLDAVGQLI